MDNQFGQMYRKIKEHPYKEAIKGFTLSTQVVVPDHFLTTDNALRFTWPTLAELNEEMSLDFGSVEDADLDTETGDSAIHVPRLYTRPHPTPPICSIPKIPLASILPQRIISSTDNERLVLVFVNGDSFMSH